MAQINPSDFIERITINHLSYDIYSLPKLAGVFNFELERIPYSHRILLENLLRSGSLQVEQLIGFHSPRRKPEDSSIQFFPARILMQDLTGIPLIVDLATMRDKLQKLGKDPRQVNPKIPVDLIIDHSIQVDHAGYSEAMNQNSKLEYERNRERYEFLRWAQINFQNLKVFPPSSGIVHQINIEYLTSVVQEKVLSGRKMLFPDTVLGTDSHTTMVNGLGVLGWGVGGIEAIAAMLGEPVEIELPPVVGVYLTGKLSEGIMPTDLVLTLTQTLRRHGVVNKIVEFYGPALDEFSTADRTTIANMAPEFGATAAYFPIDQQTLDYLQLTARPIEQITLVQGYAKSEKLFREPGSLDPTFHETLTLDLSKVSTSLAGPSRPQDRVSLNQVVKSMSNFAGTSQQVSDAETLQNGSVVIAAITSCTNTSNPYSIIAAGLVAKKAAEKGIKPRWFTKTSFAPGSSVVKKYLEQAGLLQHLEWLGFQIVGYGCTTCIGNSGPLDSMVHETIQKDDLVTTAVISGNRNFSGRVHPLVKANYLSSPALVVAYSLLGNLNLDILTHPLGVGLDGKPVFLRDIWPTSQEIEAIISSQVTSDIFKDAYKNIFTGDEAWQEMIASDQPIYQWESGSTYIQPSPFLESSPMEHKKIEIDHARALLMLGDSITTDHISPAGAIPKKSTAADYLFGHDLRTEQFNSFGSRRGNAEFMMRGAFENPGFKNRLVPEKKGSYTRLVPDGEVLSILEASSYYRTNNTPLIILAGKEYGTGSSRDWAAKGPKMLGVQAVLAESIERIHRSNLVMMGILPLQFCSGETCKSLGLTGFEEYKIISLQDNEENGIFARMEAVSNHNEMTSFKVKVLINNEREWDYYLAGGILQYLLKRF